MELLFLFTVFSNIILTLLFQFVEAVSAFLWYAALLKLTTVGKGSLKTKKQIPECLKGNVLLLLRLVFLLLLYIFNAVISWSQIIYKNAKKAQKHTGP